MSDLSRKNKRTKISLLTNHLKHYNHIKYVFIASFESIKCRCEDGPTTSSIISFQNSM